MIEPVISNDPMTESDKDKFAVAVCGFLPPNVRDEAVQNVKLLMVRIKDRLLFTENRLYQYTVNELVYAYSYIKRLRTFEHFTAQYINKIVLCCCMLANKQNHDCGVENAFWFRMLGSHNYYNDPNDLNNDENTILRNLSYTTDLERPEYDSILSEIFQT